MSSFEPGQCASPGEPGDGLPSGPREGLRSARDLDRLIRVCRERGWASIVVPGEGARPCRPDEPAASVDLDRAAFWALHGDAALHGNDVSDRR